MFQFPVPLINSGAFVPDAATTAWASAVASNGGSVSTPRLHLVDDLVLGLKSDGIWAKLDRLFLLPGEDSPGARTDLVGNVLATAVNSPTFTPNFGFSNFAGATAYLDTLYAPNTNGVNYTLNSCHALTWFQNPGSFSGFPNPFGSFNGSTGIDMGTDGFSLAYRSNSGSNASFTLNSPFVGMWASSRTVSTDVNLYNDITLKGNPSLSSVSLPPNKVFIGARSDSNTPNSGTYWNGSAQVLSLGGGLSGTDIANYYVRLGTFLGGAYTQRWVDAVVAAGGSVSAGRQAAMQTLITGLFVDGIWTKLDCLWVLAAENTTSALIDLVNLAVATPTGSPTFTADRGYTGTSTGYLATPYNPTVGILNFQPTSACAFAWSNTSGTDAGSLFGQTSFQTIRLFPEYTNTDCLWRITGASETLSGFGDGTGLWSEDRSGSSKDDLYKDGTNIDSKTGGNFNPFNETLMILREGSTSTLRQCCAFGMSGSLGATGQSNLYSRLRTYMTAVGVP